MDAREEVDLEDWIGSLGRAQPRYSADDIPTAARPAPITLADSTPPAGRRGPLALADPANIAAGSALPISSTPGAGPTSGRRTPLRLIPAVSNASSEDPEDRPRRGFRALLRRWIEE
uniref:hypothetical protein n=1 Tax=Paractinoplanes polyasparticus TaxID=2856853 RepID=UPI001C845EFC|nr:hypothetical protein [Actinoplanes polyasparticus]